MSLMAAIAKIYMKKTKLRQFFSLPMDELIIEAKRRNGENTTCTLPTKEQTDCNYIDHLYLESKYHCYEINELDKRRDKAVLFIYGGGMVTAPRLGALQNAEKMAKLTGRDAWFPFYPLAYEGSVTDVTKMVHEVYVDMVGIYGANNIVIYSYSSGSNSAMSMLLYDKEQENPVGMPEKLICISPGCLPVTEEEKKIAEKLDKKDIIIPAKYINETCPAFKSMNPGDPDYMYSPQIADFTGFPETWFFYTDSEVLFSNYESFKKKFNECNVPAHFNVRKNMFHTYCTVDIFPEAKEDYNRIIGIVKGDND